MLFCTDSDDNDTHKHTDRTVVLQRGHWEQCSAYRVDLKRGKTNGPRINANFQTNKASATISTCICIYISVYVCVCVCVCVWWELDVALLRIIKVV